MIGGVLCMVISDIGKYYGLFLLLACMNKLELCEIERFDKEMSQVVGFLYYQHFC